MAEELTQYAQAKKYGTTTTAGITTINAPSSAPTGGGTTHRDSTETSQAALQTAIDTRAGVVYTNDIINIENQYMRQQYEQATGQSALGLSTREILARMGGVTSATMGFTPDYSQLDIKAAQTIISPTTGQPTYQAGATIYSGEQQRQLTPEEANIKIQPKIQPVQPQALITTQEQRAKDIQTHPEQYGLTYTPTQETAEKLATEISQETFIGYSREGARYEGYVSQPQITTPIKTTFFEQAGTEIVGIGKGMVEHPLMTAGLIGAGVATVLVPEITIPAAIVFGGLGAMQVGYGVKEITEGNIGGGVVNIALGAFGAKYATKALYTEFKPITTESITLRDIGVGKGVQRVIPERPSMILAEDKLTGKIYKTPEIPQKTITTEAQIIRYEAGDFFKRKGTVKLSGITVGKEVQTGVTSEVTAAEYTIDKGKPIQLAKVGQTVIKEGKIGSFGTAITSEGKTFETATFGRITEAGASTITTSLEKGGRSPYLIAEKTTELIRTPTKTYFQSIRAGTSKAPKLKFKVIKAPQYERDLTSLKEDISKDIGTILKTKRQEQATTKLGFAEKSIKESILTLEKQRPTFSTKSISLGAISVGSLSKSAKAAIFKQTPLQKQIPIQKQFPVQQQTPAQELRQIQRQEQRQVQELRQTRIQTQVTGITAVPPIIPTFVPTIKPIIPPFGMGGMGRKGRGALPTGKGISRAYTPDITALAYNIKGKGRLKAYAQREYTGLELRRKIR